MQPGETLITGGNGDTRYARFQQVAMGNAAASGGFRNLKVYEPGISWSQQEIRWRLIEQLTQGTLGMQAAGRTYLPQEPAEDDDSYSSRLRRSICPPYYLRLEQMLAGMLTRKPIRLDNVPDVMTEQLYDVDLSGSGLDPFLQGLARTCIRYGHVGVLVDYPRGDEGDDTPVTDFSRPYWLPYSPRDILGWRTDVVGGTQKLTQLRLRETLTVPYGEWGEEMVEQVRVLEPGRFRVYRKQASRSRDWELISEGTTTMEDIPFAVAYANRVATLESTPPLEEVAWLNLLAYQCESDQGNLLHVAATPRYNLFGVPAEVEEIDAGPNSATAFPSDARAEFAEPTGTSYDARFKQLDRIQQQIAELGLAAVLGQNMTNQAAESKAIDRSQGDAALQAVAIGLQDLIDQCLTFHAAYLGLPDGGSSMVNNDFVARTLEPSHVAELIKLRTLGEITQETLLIQLADGEWLYDGFDVDEEIEATAAQQARKLQAQQDQLDASVQQLPGQPTP
jgi:hypothetical protein